MHDPTCHTLLGRSSRAGATTAACFLLPLLGRFSGLRGAVGGCNAAPAALPAAAAASCNGCCCCCTSNAGAGSAASAYGCSGGCSVTFVPSAAGRSASAMRLLKCGGCLASAVSWITNGCGCSRTLPPTPARITRMTQAGAWLTKQVGDTRHTVQTLMSASGRNVPNSATETFVVRARMGSYGLLC
jgi:hypothetical protein